MRGVVTIPAKNLFKKKLIITNNLDRMEESFFFFTIYVEMLANLFRVCRKDKDTIYPLNMATINFLESHLSHPSHCQLGIDT